MKTILGAALVALLVTAAPALAQDAPREAVVIVMDGASLPELLAEPGLRSLAVVGGGALMNGRTDVRDAFTETFFGPRSVGRFPFSFVDIGAAQPSDAAAAVMEELTQLTGPTLVVMVSASPSPASAADGDELGTVIAAWGDPAELLEASGEPHALTSDSTRRAGVVADVDPAATVADWLGLPYDAGSPMRPTGEPAPLDLYERYLQQRRLAVPVAAGAWVLMLLFGLAGFLALGFRERVSPRLLAVAGALVGSLPWLALGLLLVGHLPSLSYTTVVPFLLALLIAGVAFTRWVAARRSIFVALAACGAAILVILGVEAALGWPAAVTPLAGGGQLDGGRFFGMPNIEIGIVLGSALFLAHRVRVGSGVLLLAACALVAGSPWTGANLGAAITLFAAAGMWLAIRRRRPWWMAVLITGAITAVGMAAIAVMHRYLTDRPTHVSAFLEETTSLAGVVDRLVDRLGIGFDQLMETPVVLIPVVGTLVLLFVVIRPPPASLGASRATTHGTTPCS